MHTGDSATPMKLHAHTPEHEPVTAIIWLLHRPPPHVCPMVVHRSGTRAPRQKGCVAAWSHRGTWFRIEG